MCGCLDQLLQISPVLRYFLSYANLRKLIPSQGFMRTLDMSKMSTKIDIDISKVTSYGAGLWRSVANANREPEIPLPKEELALALKAEGSGAPGSDAQAMRSKGPKVLTDADIENAIADLLEYLNQCMSVLKHTLSETGETASFLFMYISMDFPSYLPRCECSKDDCVQSVSWQLGHGETVERDPINHR